MNGHLYLWLIPVLPFAGFVLNGIFGARLPKRLVTAIALLAPLAAFGVVVNAAATIYLYVTRCSLCGPPNYGWSLLPLVENYGTWIKAGSLHIDFSFVLDQLSLVMLLVITGVGLLIHIYSVGYMAHEKGYWRYFSYLNLFLFFMTVLVLAGNALVMFVGWEGVGLASYLLIGFWFQKTSAADAGKKAFVVNRIGDFGFLIGMFLLLGTFGTLTFSEIGATLAVSPGMQGGVVTAIALCLLLGATGKSAQLPLYVWLPDAMEGPTPVSALIHAATMVTAGVYMIARTHAIYDRSPFALTVVAIVGAATALFAATIGLVQTDIKRVLAYSTVSQLGYMFLGCGVAAYSAAIFHLMTHAFFKALLFLGAGSVIHGMGGEQDMRKMGGLRHKMPITFWTFVAATFALCGIFPFAGFFSKDEIIWQAFSHGHFVVWLFLLLGAGCTVFYMSRQVYMTFFGEFRGTHEQEHHLHESPPSMSYVLIVLGLLSVVGGWLKFPEFMIAFKPFEEFLDPIFSSEVTHRITESGIHHHGIEAAFAVITFVVVIVGWYLADMMYRQHTLDPARFSEMFGGVPYEWVYNKYYVDEFYDRAMVQPYLFATRTLAWFDTNIIDGVVNLAARIIVFGSWLSGLFDKYVVDALVNFASNVTFEVGGRLRRLQTGSINGYLYGILAAVMLILLVRAVGRS